jgi:hypothetical protein
MHPGKKRENNSNNPTRGEYYETETQENNRARTEHGNHTHAFARMQLRIPLTVTTTPHPRMKEATVRHPRVLFTPQSEGSPHSAARGPCTPTKHNHEVKRTMTANQHVRDRFLRNGDQSRA